MNTGFLGPAVATVLTVYGIETEGHPNLHFYLAYIRLQQYLPFTVLKLIDCPIRWLEEPLRCNSTYRLRY